MSKKQQQEVDGVVKVKSPSKRLRDLIFVLYEESLSKMSFDDFYLDKMQSFFDSIRVEIDFAKVQRLEQPEEDDFELIDIGPSDDFELIDIELSEEVELIDFDEPMDIDRAEVEYDLKFLRTVRCVPIDDTTYSVPESALQTRASSIIKRLQKIGFKFQYAIG